ncbi:GTP-binding protein [Billgrantia saliphila]|uniref:GTP-binding protein n=1 Tax=Billgrantia saliphila TaxID=1848458 RepID=UPI001E306F6C|nr:GTP-binding protein [Halomonas saliphila]
MASIVKTPSGSWKVVIRKTGWPTTAKTFRTKRDAQDWARRTEDEMVRGVYTQRSASERMTLEAALKRYLADITPTKKPSTQKCERHKANTLIEQLGKYSLAALTPELIASYRDTRLNSLGRRGAAHQPQYRAPGTRPARPSLHCRYPGMGPGPDLQPRPEHPQAQPGGGARSAPEPRRGEAAVRWSEAPKFRPVRSGLSTATSINALGLETLSWKRESAMVMNEVSALLHEMPKQILRFNGVVRLDDGSVLARQCAAGRLTSREIENWFKDESELDFIGEDSPFLCEWLTQRLDSL